MTDPLQLTLAWWYNGQTADGTGQAKILAHSGPYTQFLYGTQAAAPGVYPVAGKVPLDGPVGQPQLAVVCSPQSGVIVVDVDDAGAYASSLTARLLGKELAWCTRGENFHIALDCRHLPRESWPLQGATDWGDIKANGFVPLPGSLHKSGVTYEVTGKLPVIATDEILTALKADRDDHEIRNPEGGHGHDGYLASLCFRLYLEGKDFDEIRTAWELAAAPQDAAWPFTDSDFERHMRNVPEKVRIILEEEEAEREREYDWYDLIRGWDREKRVMECRMGSYSVPPVAFAKDNDDEVFEVPETFSFYEERLGLTGPGSFDPPCGNDDPDLAEWILARWRDNLRYDTVACKWWLNCGDHWEPVAEDLADWAVLRLRRHLPMGNPDADPTEIGIVAAAREHVRAKRLGKFGKDYMSIARAMRVLVKAHHPSSLKSSEMDAEPDVLWAGNIPWSIRDSLGEMVPATWIKPSTPHERTAKYRPDHTLPTPLWDQLVKVVWPDEPMRAWAIRLLAIGFTGESSVVTPMLIGKPNSGKTAISALLLNILGSYGHTAPAEILEPNSGNRDFQEIQLKGRRFSFIDEAPQPGRQHQRRLKNITGGGMRSARPPYGKGTIEFPATHTMVMTGNRGPDDPILSDEAVRRRIRLIACEGEKAEVDAAMRDIGYYPFSDAWKREAPGVLAKMIMEAAAYFDDPACVDQENAPVAAQILQADIIADQDTVLTWFEEETEFSSDGTKSTELLKNYFAWCKDRGMFAVNRNEFKARMCQLCGIPEPIHTNRGRFYPRKIKLDGWGFLTPQNSPSEHVPSPAPVQPLDSPLVPEKPVTATEACIAGAVIGIGAESSSPAPSVSPDKPSSNLNDRASQGALTVEQAQAFFEADEDPEKVAVLFDEAPKQRTRKPKLTDEEKSARAAERKEAQAMERARLLAEKIAEAEGPHRNLPVLVFRDGVVREVSVAEAGQAARMYISELSVDVENTGYPVGHKDYAIRLVQVGGAEVAAVLDPNDPPQADLIRNVLADATLLHAHSAVADIVPLVAAGLGDKEQLWDKMEDSVLIAKLNDPQSTNSDANGLKQLAKDVLGTAALSPAADKARSKLFTTMKCLTETSVTTPVEKSGWASVSLKSETFQRYSGADVLDLGGVIQHLPRPDERVLREREAPFQKICARISHHDGGFKLDYPHIKNKIAEFETKREEAQQKAYELSGGTIDNPKSSKVLTALQDMGVALPPHPKTGNVSADKSSLEMLISAEPDGEFVPLFRQILEYRHDDTTLGLLLRPLEALCVHGDGRMRPTILTINADTGRTSCVRPNGQQFSRQGGIRSCVTADDGWWGIRADFEGCEIRVAAALSQDFGLLRAELDGDGLDPSKPGLHWMAAHMAFGPEATKEHRYWCKRGIFCRLFGGAPPTAARQVFTTKANMQKVFAAFNSVAQGYVQWDNNMRAYVQAGNRAWQAYSGRTIWLPRGRQHAAGNYAIQGTARELLVDGVLRWNETRWGHFPILPVHDEIVTFIKGSYEEALEAKFALEQCMKTELYGVPIVADASDDPFRSWPDAS